MSERPFTKVRARIETGDSESCSGGYSYCMYENIEPCFHCGTIVVEHVDEDGTPRDVKPVPQ